VLSARPARVPSPTREGEETAITSMAHPTTTRPQITVGVDTHLDVHVAHACDQLGRRVDTVQVPTTPTGYHDLLAWARGLGEPVAWGVEGTGSYGAALALPCRRRPGRPGGQPA
jgi:transposase